MWEYFTKKPTPPRGISLFYNLFQHKLEFTKSPPYQKWESDLGIHITNTQWQHAFRSLHKATRCVNHWELSQKMALRWYLTPYRVSKFGNHNSPLCWRNCGSIGNLLHMFWTCKHLTSFWGSIFRSISTITGILTRPKPSLAILNIGIELFPPEFRTVITHIFLVARTLIAKHWRTDKAPNVSEVLTTSQTHYVYESLLAGRSGQKEKFDNQWKIWTTWFKGNKG